jgi:hypothetical protein
MVCDSFQAFNTAAITYGNYDRVVMVALFDVTIKKPMTAVTDSSLNSRGVIAR